MTRARSVALMRAHHAFARGRRSWILRAAPVSALLLVALLALSARAVDQTKPHAQAAKVGAPVFNRDIRPILSDNCFACHGPDKNKRQGDLRLDQPNRTVVPGKTAASELVKRISLPEGAPGHMPPASGHKKLTAPQIETLNRWIAAGGQYQKHWSYEPPVKVSVPAGVNPIDYLVRKRLVEVGLKPSPTADR